jgi:hypothetical protein
MESHSASLLASSATTFKGKLVIPATFQQAYPFQEGLAAVQINERWGFINPQGQMVSHGIIEVLLDGKTGYINTKGEWAWPPSE